MHYHSEALIRELAARAQTFRINVLEMVYRNQTGHIGGAFSAAEMLAALYFHHLKIDPARPDWPERDRLIFSKGHACAALYSALAHRGFFPVEELTTFRQLDSRLQGHPDPAKCPGVDSCSGPLGHGVAVGVGMALAQRMNVPKPSAASAPSARASAGKTYVILGDGEINAGVVWEGVMSAAKYRLGNLTAILDYNGIQQTGATVDVMPTEPIGAKWEAFGWHVQEVHGHNVGEMLNALDFADEFHARPSVIIARTTKGKGVSFMEYDNRWHGTAPNQAQYEAARAELEEGLQPMAKLGSPPMAPMRPAYGKALLKLGEANPDVVALSADVSNSDFSYMFAEAFPDRFFNVGIAEQSLVDVAAGLAYSGKIPFANAFAFLFATRALEMIRTHLCYGRANVKLMAAYAGLSDSFNGPTHNAISDVAIMRSLPRMTVVVPGDTVAVDKLLPQVAAWPGPVYFRMNRNEVPVIFDETYAPEIGKAVPLRAGSDVTLICNGMLVSRCLVAADLLAAENIRAAVLEMHTVKPLDTEAVLAAARETGALVTAEEHSVLGGLGGAVAEVVSDACPVPLKRVGVADRFAETGPYHALLERYGMGVSHIVAAARAAATAK